MQNHTRNYWWLNANPTHWSFDSFNPGEDAFYWNANPDGSPRKAQSNFEKVAIGDLVVGYSTTPDKVIKCLCQIVEPNDGKKFTIRKLLDLPVPIRQSEWSKLPAFKTFQYRGTLYQLDNGQWNALASLIRKRNPSARLPFSEKTYTLRGLFAEMMASPYTTWHDNFKEAFARFSKKEPLSEADLRALVFEKSNGIASAGQSVITNDFYKTLSSDSRFLNALRDFRAQLSASSFHHLADICDSLAEENNHRKFRLKVNRIASALTTSVSAVPDEYAFGKVLQWLKERNLLGFEPGGNDCWFEDNQQLVSMLDRELSDVKGYDVWYRNIFPWWIYEEMIKNGTSFVYNPPTHSMKQSLNTILYGPPGTGKTYNTADYAVAIIEGKSVEDIQQESHDEIHKRFLGYKEQKRIAFTTFHQSYGYEDFIEGIRPVLDDESEETSEVRYELHDGIFKEFCKRAAEAKAVERDDYDIRTGASVWKVSLERTGDNKTRKDCLKNGYIRIGWDEYGPDITDETFKNSASGKTVLKAFIDRMQIGDVVVSCWSANETDAIGVVTGDYEWHDEFAEYKRLRKVNWLWVAKDEKENIRKINHECGMVLSTVYRLKIDLPDILSLVHKHRSKNAPLQNEASPCVFVIDEINRGNISKIFGELITLVEPSKRLGAAEETKAKLPYSGDDFGVPSNVYILGTMNTADRSIALLDTALRRRFEFVEMMPNPELLADINVGDTGINLEMMLRAMNDRIEFLLDREHTIGHAYFLGDFKDHPTLAGLAEIFRNKIVPLLQEYFFDDYSKIRLVLGDNGKKETAVQFFNEKKPDDVFFGNAEDAVDPDRCVYRINKAAFGNPAAYIGIYDEKTV